MPEIMSRHASTMPYARRLAHRFFNNTSVDVKKKLAVAGSLNLSREIYGAGGYPNLTLTERQRIHSNVVGVYRQATSENFAAKANDGVSRMLSDQELLHISRAMGTWGERT